MPFQAPAVITPFAKLIPEITERLVEATFMVPPMNAFPVMPIPPDTVNAPVVVLEEFVKLVTAKPDTVTNPDEGLTTKEVIVDNPSPEPFEELTVVMKND